MATTTKPEDRLAMLMQRLLKLRLAEIPRLDYDLSFSQMEILWFIIRSSKCRVQDIADGLGITPPTVSVALKRLEDAGWLERHPDPEDGRATRSTLTEKSVQMMERVQAAQHSGIAVPCHTGPGYRLHDKPKRGHYPLSVPGRLDPLLPE